MPLVSYTIKIWKSAILWTSLSFAVGILALFLFVSSLPDSALPELALDPFGWHVHRIATPRDSDRIPPEALANARQESRIPESQIIFDWESPLREREMAILLLVRNSPELVEPILYRLLENEYEHPRLRTAATQALAAIHPNPEVAELQLIARENPSLTERVSAIIALGRAQGSTGAEEALRRLQQEGLDPETRRAAEMVSRKNP